MDSTHHLTADKRLRYASSKSSLATSFIRIRYTQSALGRLKQKDIKRNNN